MKSMSATAFRKWLKHMGYSHAEAARELGVSRTSVIKWSREGAPKSIQLAGQQLANSVAVGVPE